MTINKILSFVFLLIGLSAYGQKIDRKAVLKRNNPVITRADSLASLTVGNGSFAFTVDVTGLQSFPLHYKKGVPLGTQSEWGWHSFIDTVGFKREEALKNYKVGNREVSYLTQWNNPERKKKVSDWYRENPHRLQLGQLGLILLKKNGDTATIQDLTGIRQELDLYNGCIKSSFTLEGVPVQVTTYAHGIEDAISAEITSPLLRQKRIKLLFALPYPTAAWTDEGVNFETASQQRSYFLMSHSNGAVIARQLDSLTYYAGFAWEGEAGIKQKDSQHFIISPQENKNSFEISLKFRPNRDFSFIPEFAQTRASSESSWNKYWNSGAAIDLSSSTDTRWKELERRIVLSQYLMRVQEAGYYPPQETGLTYNSWYGKPHLEMHWWHAAHYALWGRPEFLERSMNWYFQVADEARKLAARQGYLGLRWQKMTNNAGEESPSSIGAMLIWQQPHFIYFAELLRRSQPGSMAWKKYANLVFETADFMASYPTYDSVAKRYNLGPALIPAQERFKADSTINPPFELVYWHWGLETAQKWRMQMGMPRNKKWDEILAQLAKLPVKDSRYLFTESANDSYTNPEFRTDHPAVLGALGMLPPTGQVNEKLMQNTFDWIWKNWTWSHTWGWDFGLTAMTATRLNRPSQAMDALLMGIQTNTYLPNGHNYQDSRLRIYLPGNGALLAAAAMMFGGYDGSSAQPGVPRNGKWSVKAEGFARMP